MILEAQFPTTSVAASTAAANASLFQFTRSASIQWIRFVRPDA